MEENRTSLSELENRIELLARQLSEAEVTIQSLSMVKGDFISLASHDLRTPLAIIIGEADLLQESLAMAGLDGYEQHSVETIIAAAQQMNAMIQDLVDSMRLEAGLLKINRGQVDLGLLVYDLTERLIATTKTDRLRREIPEDLPLVWADQERMSRVVTNLVTNALKYSSPDAPVIVKISGGEGVVVSVTDFGIGISPEHLPHIFDRLYRATGVRKADGLGIGLYLSRMLVDAHGGHIWAESSPGIGSTFYFSLPVAESIE